MLAGRARCVAVSSLDQFVGLAWALRSGSWTTLPLMPECHARSRSESPDEINILVQAAHRQGLRASKQHESWDPAAASVCQLAGLSHLQCAAAQAMRFYLSLSMSAVHAVCLIMNGTIAAGA